MGRDSVVRHRPRFRRPLKEGDVVTLDLALSLNGYCVDTARTVPVGKVSDDAIHLIKVTEECLDLGIAQCWPNKRVGDIGWAIQQHAEKFGYGIVRDYTGHGIGRSMHEAPQIPNHVRQGTREKIRVGYCFAIEPMLNLGSPETLTLDEWRAASDLCEADVLARITPAVSVQAKRTPQSTAPDAVGARLAEVRRWLDGLGDLC